MGFGLGGPMATKAQVEVRCSLYNLGPAANHFLVNLVWGVFDSVSMFFGPVQVMVDTSGIIHETSALDNVISVFFWFFLSALLHPLGRLLTLSLGRH